VLFGGIICMKVFTKVNNSHSGGDE